MTSLPIQKAVPLTEIDLGERARKDYRDLEAISESIKSKGLIHPIALSRHPHPERGIPYLLVAGGRRFRAHQSLGADTVLSRIYDHVLTDLEYRSIELEENIQREDLDWKEKAFLEREIHRLQVQIHGEKVARSADAPGHSMSDTAALLGVSKAKVSQDISLADAIEQFPDAPWEKCKSASDAQKLKSRMEKTIVNDHLAIQAQKTMGNADQRIQRMFDSYIVRDFFDGVAELPKEYFDFVELDPPYGIDLQTAKAKKGLGADGLMDYNEVDAKEYPKFLAKVIKECYRVMKPNSYMVFWFGPDPWFELIASLLEGAGFRVPRIPGIWIKPSGQTNSPTTRLASAYEMFFYAAKGSPTIAKPGTRNVFQFDPVSPDKKRHPTQRPEPMIQSVLETFAPPNSKVLVPFAGSGATLLAAMRSNMIPIGFDLSKAYRDKYILHIKETNGQ
jgi:site-specific DNA-methyltransferase (adenine-specific)